MITPTVGRIVWFYRYALHQGHKGPIAAIVTEVIDDRTVNLTIFAPKTPPTWSYLVRLVQDNEEVPQGDYCAWMPYQKGQAAKTEALEKKMGL